MSMGIPYKPTWLSCTQIMCRYRISTGRRITEPRVRWFNEGVIWDVHTSLVEPLGTPSALDQVTVEVDCLLPCKADSLAEGELPVGILMRLDRRRGRGWQVFTDFVIVRLVDYCPRWARFELLGYC